MNVVDCNCGQLHLVRWDADAGIDGAYVYVCSRKGPVTLLRALDNPPGRVVTDYSAEAERS